MSRCSLFPRHLVEIVRQHDDAAVRRARRSVHERVNVVAFAIQHDASVRSLRAPLFERFNPPQQFRFVEEAVQK